VIANALVHAGGECWVTVSWTCAHLRVEVTDRSLKLPDMLPESMTSNSGRGLALVNALASSWGWEPKELGKIVYFLIAADSQLTGDPRLIALLHTAGARVPAPDDS
jgi:hypothetical protein